MTHAHHHGHHKGHAHGHDRGLRGVVRYLRLAPLMWRSELNDAVVGDVAPSPRECVVDVGAGMGAATLRAANTGASVIAVDPLPVMRAVLRMRRALHPHRKNVRIVDGAAEQLPIPAASVDVLFTVNTLHHWVDRSAAARELARVMRPGGRVLLVDEQFGDPAHPEHESFMARRPGRALHFDDVDVEALADALRTAGFTSAAGTHGAFAARPSKVVRAVR